MTEELAPEVFDLEAALEAIPLDVAIADGVDLDSEDPSYIQETGRRLCVGERRAGGRCTAPAHRAGLLCSAHSGLIDPASGARARAEKRRQQLISDEEVARLVRIGIRGVAAELLHARPLVTARIVDTLMDMAAAGDLQAIKALPLWLNQGLGMPTETVRVEDPASSDDIRSMPTDELRAWAAARRGRPTEVEAETA